jgi:hypothetical protein
MSRRGGYSPATISAIRLQKLREILVEEPTVAEQELHAAGWRRCAEGQAGTQHCALLEAAVLAEREACAKVAEDYWDEGHCEIAVREIAAAIRARGNT